jgi:HEAT repeat protein
MRYAGPDAAASAVPALASLVRTSNGRLRLDAIRAIGEFGGAGRPALPSLVGVMRDPNRRIHTAAAITIGQIAPDRMGVAMEELTGLLNDPGIAMQQEQAAAGLAKIGPQALPFFLAALTNSSPRVRSRAAFHLQDMGSNALPAIPSLVGTLDDADWLPAQSACWSLGALKAEPELVVPALAKLLDGPKAECKVPALIALSRFGEQARPALPAIVRACASSGSDVRGAATNALRKIAPEVLEREKHDGQPVNQ